MLSRGKDVRRKGGVKWEKDADGRKAVAIGTITQIEIWGRGEGEEWEDTRISVVSPPCRQGKRSGMWGIRKGAESDRLRREMRLMEWSKNHPSTHFLVLSKWCFTFHAKIEVIFISKPRESKKAPMICPIPNAESRNDRALGKRRKVIGSDRSVAVYLEAKSPEKVGKLWSAWDEDQISEERLYLKRKSGNIESSAGFHFLFFAFFCIYSKI